MPDILDQLVIHSDCGQDPANMRPDGSGRRYHCDACIHPVHDISAMTESEVRALFASEERICARYFVDGDGYVLVQPDRLSLGAGARRAVVAAALPLAAAACDEPAPAQPQAPARAMPVASPEQAAASVGSMATPRTPQQANQEPSSLCQDDPGPEATSDALPPTVAQQEPALPPRPQQDAAARESPPRNPRPDDSQQAVDDAPSEGRLPPRRPRRAVEKLRGFKAKRREIEEVQPEFMCLGYCGSQRELLRGE